MRATIDWSYRLLDADEQQVFLWLAVFANGFELDAGHHVFLSQPQAVADLVRELARA